MGMFDTLHCKYPLPGNPPRVNDFQTKDLECLLDRYTISEEGRLILHKVRVEEVPEEERPYYGTPEWETNPIVRFLGHLREVPVGDEDMNYSGELYFYDYVDGQRYDYIANFKDGTVEQILNK